MGIRGQIPVYVPWPLRQQCLSKPDTTKARKVAFFQGKRLGQQRHTDRMKAKIDSAAGKHMIAARFATVDGQWKLYCMTHNIEKLPHHGYGE